MDAVPLPRQCLPSVPKQCTLSGCTPFTSNHIHNDLRCTFSIYVCYVIVHVATGGAPAARPVYPEVRLSLPAQPTASHLRATFSSALAGSPSGMFLMHTLRTTPPRGFQLATFVLCSQLQLFRTFGLQRGRAPPKQPPSHPAAAMPTSAAKEEPSSDVEMISDAQEEVDLPCMGGVHESAAACIASMRAAVSARVATGGMAGQAVSAWEVGMALAASSAMHVEHAVHCGNSRTASLDMVWPAKLRAHPACCKCMLCQFLFFNLWGCCTQAEGHSPVEAKTYLNVNVYAFKIRSSFFIINDCAAFFLCL